MMLKDNNFISAVVYLHNDGARAVEFCRTVAAELDANFKQYELVVVDDACTDDTVKQLRAWGREQDAPLTILHMSIYHGLEDAMNAGLDAAIGDYVYEFDSTELCYAPTLIMQAYRAALDGSDSFVIERLGVYKETWSVGLHFKIPFLDRVSRKVNLKEQVADFEPQPVITRDNVTMQIDTIIFYQITDPKLYAYGVENPIVAIKSLTATTLRNIVGDLELDETLTSRETINAKMRTELDVATDPWGIKVNRVELKNIIPPRDIQEAMEKQMRAEREKREQILRAEGEKKSAVLIAEGKKEAAILNAEADNQAAVLKADAEKKKRILEAEGEAQAILSVQKATADGIKAIKEAGADEAVLTLKSLEAFAAAADGQATKIIIPSEIQGIAGSVKALAEVIKD